MTCSPRVTVRGVSVEADRQTLLASTDLTIGSGESVAIMGPSGSGKTTLLSCISGLIAPSNGNITVDGVSITDLKPAARVAFRREKLGLIFQEPELLDELSVSENVSLQLIFSGASRAEARRVAVDALAELGISHLADAVPSRLSGGEAQRVAVARALSTSATVILADEPTASLDTKNVRQVTELLLKSASDRASSVLIATHDPVVAELCDRTVLLRETVRPRA